MTIDGSCHAFYCMLLNLNALWRAYSVSAAHSLCSSKHSCLPVNALSWASPISTRLYTFFDSLYFVVSMPLVGLIPFLPKYQLHNRMPIVYMCQCP